MTTFIPIAENDINELVPYAESIWKEHYYTCVDKGLTDYVFKLYMSEEAVRRQFSEGSRFYYVKANGKDGKKAGYFSIYPKEGKMYLSKLYLHKDYRGRGLSKDIISFIKEEAKKEDLHEIFLNVNRANVKSIEAYKHLGFYIAEEVETNLGDGFIAQDYIMELKI